MTALFSCSFGDLCKVSHERPAATEARVPAEVETRGQDGDGNSGGDGISSAGGQGGDGVSNVLVVQATGVGGAGARDGAQGGGS